MKRQYLSQKTKRERVKREATPLSWRYRLLTLVCGLIFAAGLFFAACQHFSAIGYGIKNAKLRQQKEDLEAEQRRLYLNREILLTPNEIKKAAKKIGLKELTIKDIEAVNQKIASVTSLAKIVPGEKLKQAVSQGIGNKDGKKIKEEKKSSEKGNKEINPAKVSQQFSLNNRQPVVQKVISIRIEKNTKTRHQNE